VQKKARKKSRQILLREVVANCLKLQKVGHIDNCYGNKAILLVHDLADGMFCKIWVTAYWSRCCEFLQQSSQNTVAFQLY
jgi:hypothetical protein